MIEVVDLEKSYGEYVKAVHGVSFTINAGEIIGLLGPNGAGKTTIMKILTGFHHPGAGTVRIQGKDITENSLEVRKLIGYLPENAPLYPELSVKEYLEFIADARLGPKGITPGGLGAEAAIERAVEACGLKSVWLKNIDTLSKGYRQRVGLAQAILHDPPILILDEPTTGLDPNQIIEIRNLMIELGKTKTVILSTHILQEVEAVCQRIFILNKGKIVAQGTSADIQSSLRGDWRARVRVQGGDEAFAQLKSGLPDWVKSKPAETEGFFELSASRNDSASIEQLQIAVGTAAVKKAVVVLESSPIAASLEDLFISLTKEARE